MSVFLLPALQVPTSGDVVVRSLGNLKSVDEVTLVLVGRGSSTQGTPVEKAGVELAVDSKVVGTDQADEEGFYVVELRVRDDLRFKHIISRVRRSRCSSGCQHGRGQRAGCFWVYWC